MRNSDDTLSQQVRSAWNHEVEKEPSFDHVWHAATARHVAHRRRYRLFSSAAAITAAVIVGLNLQPPAEKTYIEVADLLETTYWSAPSDVLLPDREFDIYQDMPELFESTEPAGGALL